LAICYSPSQEIAGNPAGLQFHRTAQAGNGNTLLSRKGDLFDHTRGILLACPIGKCLKQPASVGPIVGHIEHGLEQHLLSDHLEQQQGLNTFPAGGTIQRRGRTGMTRGTHTDIQALMRLWVVRDQNNLVPPTQARTGGMDPQLFGRQERLEDWI
jgi:hypothetical protein